MLANLPCLSCIRSVNSVRLEAARPPTQYVKHVFVHVLSFNKAAAAHGPFLLIRVRLVTDCGITIGRLSGCLVRQEKEKETEGQRTRRVQAASGTLLGRRSLFSFLKCRGRKDPGRTMHLQKKCYHYPCTSTSQYPSTPWERCRYIALSMHVCVAMRHPTRRAPMMIDSNLVPPKSQLTAAKVTKPCIRQLKSETNLNFFYSLNLSLYLALALRNVAESGCERTK
ncbi:hypothetical protein CGRA01v4_13679 [Colletotrichum graminicola]|nr:hypothetical protein CGRA01v4_13679 [Colletotrichum graminicola]